MHIISSSETRTKFQNQSNQKGVDSTDAILNFQVFLAMVQKNEDYKQDLLLIRKNINQGSETREIIFK